MTQTLRLKGNGSIFVEVDDIVLVLLKQTSKDIWQKEINERWNGIPPSWYSKPPSRYSRKVKEIPEYCLQMLCSFDGVTAWLQANKDNSISIDIIDTEKRKHHQKAKINYEHELEIVEDKLISKDYKNME